MAAMRFQRLDNPDDWDWRRSLRQLTKTQSGKVYCWVYQGCETTEWYLARLPTWVRTGNYGLNRNE